MQTHTTNPSKEAQARAVYNKYWQSYFEGDEGGFVSTLDPEYRLIGSSENEICQNKSEGEAYFRAQMEELGGKFEFRNREIRTIPVGELFLVEEFAHVYLLVEQEWSFYAKLRLSTLLRSTNEGWKVFQQHGSLPDMRPEDGETVAINRIWEENLQLKDAIQRRTVELENKNRELEIEAALQRVRSRTMAMQHSDELSDAAFLLAQQVRDLGIEAWGCAFHIYADDPEGDYEWFSNPDGYLPFYKTPRKRYFREFYEKRAAGEKLFVKEFKGKQCAVHYDYLLSLPVVGDALRDLQKAGIPLPESQIDHVAYFKYGYLLFITYAHVPEAHSVFTRFAGEFEQTYTRFLDLKKAEAQAREAQIETALERVRSRSMGMQTSEELQEVVKVIFDQLANLDINAEHAGIVVDFEPKKDWHFWTADNQAIPSRITVPYLDLPWDRQFAEAKKKGIDFFETYLDFEDKNRFYEVLLPHIKGLSRKAKNFYLRCSGLAISTVVEKDIGLYIENFSGTPYTEEENEVLMRFGKVFQQTYTRFLDLQKAEEQAREAQIEAGLERIRNRALIMKDSKELNVVVSVFFNEFSQLNLLPPEARTYFCDINTVTHEAEVWMTYTNGEVMSGSHFTPLTRSASMKKYYEAWKRKEPISVRGYKGKDLDAYISFVSSLPHVKKDKDYKRLFKNPPNQIFMTDANFRQGNIGVMSYEPLSEEAQEVLQRFAKVFEFTYTRFLDLQKAEAQAREAQIEAALERVRAQTMAMHTSEDVGKCVIKMFDELTALGVHEGTRFGIGILNPNDEINQLWTALKEGKKVKMHIGNLDMTSHPLLRSARTAWKEQVSLHKYVLEGKDLRDYYLMLNKAPDYKLQVAIEKLPEKEIHYGFIFDHGFFYAFTPDEFQPDLIHTIQRFSLLFGQTYRRYLDLKKAENQAREAQIEAALERVRAASMAMHNSEELNDIVLILYHQMELLGFTPFGCSIALFDSDKKGFTYWFSFPSSKTLEHYFVPLKGVSLIQKIYRQFEKKTKQFDIELKGQKKRNFDEYLFENTRLKNYPELKDAIFSQSYVLFSFASMQYGTLHVISHDGSTSSELKGILPRFASVFQQTYTRFLDLKKSEEQAREAQIEAALERVRASSMAMHKTDELGRVVEVLFEQFSEMELDFYQVWINIFNLEEGISNCWFSPVAGIIEKPYTAVVPLGPFEETSIKSWRAGDPFSYLSWKGKKEIDEVFQRLSEMTGHPSFHQIQKKKKMKRVEIADCNHKYGVVAMAKNDTITDKDRGILSRFTKVFEQAYTRFLDLQKAEEQAREAQIEAALERVRSRTMAMHRSDELAEAANLLFLEIQSLGINAWSAGYNILEEDLTAGNCVMSSEGVMQTAFRLPYTGEKSFIEWHKAIESDADFYVQELEGKDLKEHYEYLVGLPGVQESIDPLEDAGISFPTYQINHLSFFEQGFLLFITYEKVPEAHDLFRRFTKVFEQTYTRFLDLKKAEAQAREAQIEAALERVRASAMSMHSSEDVLNATSVMFNELDGLGIETIRCGVTVIRKDRQMEAWASVPSEQGRVVQVTGAIDMTIHPLFVELYEGWHRKDERFEFPLTEDEARAYYKKLATTSSFQVPAIDKLGVAQRCNAFYFPEGSVYGFTESDLSEEAIDIFQRFARVFTLTYRRYIDLKQAEAREKEAIKQSSLDRIRGEISSMRTTKDLERITPLIWKELITLGVPFFRCGVFIMREDEEMMHAYLSTPSGDSLGALHLNFEDTELGLVEASLENWRKQQEYQEEWDREQFVENMRRFQERGQIQNTESYQAGEEPPEKLVLQLVPFKQGMLYAGNSEPLIREHINLMRDLARTFSVAYSRYEDFVQLEEAKSAVESTLTDLKSTQSQLVHAEKMASLGELTAGIAHEIQNPLNFVNNFSEINKELVEELKEAVAANDQDEIDAIMEDLLENEDKVMHHGKRAEGIVKSMLQHSRGSSKEMELTDINALADEYLRLAYHGLRAKDKSFQADFRTELDDELRKINVIPQELGRVLLNLINNAFYAVAEKRNQGKPGYNPAVTVGTEQLENSVIIRVKDNGNGIPKKVVDKIFQPFFTTKPTGQGTGLGLSLSYDIITKIHGGSLEVMTEEEKGTEFIVELPISPLSRGQGG